ncbi:MAG TPA: single-stranded-DNA-specific exonuclease RecJ [Casimicrobiaceae bacterium]|nr:single-stranded-DNA-specific exonuclease RecJ [Casimicrobiaceae bacterium]
MHPVLARIYAARGVRSSEELDIALVGLPTYSSLRGIEAATQRLVRAIEHKERIVVVADYDADGATACAIAVRGLHALGADVAFAVPNRFEHGYGLTAEIVAHAAARSPQVIVTVDNGIASHEGVAAAAARGIDVVITDHHLPAATLPEPAWIVNPNQPGCAFPCKHLAGVGVMFYVLLALRATLRARGHRAAHEVNLASLLDIVALGTVADVVRLDRVNRTLVAQGLRRIRAGRAQPGVHALLAAAGRDPACATTYDLAFVAGPRLNAAGRLADMSLGIRCLLADSREAALPLAAELDRLNRERRALEGEMQEAALLDLAARVADDAGAADRCTLCLYRPEWHQGVIGIVASRLKDRFHRPCIVFAQDGKGELKGSGRSIAGLHLRDALDLVAKRAPGTVLRFGGHAYAAGVSIAPEALPRFAQAFEEVAAAQLSPADLRRRLDSDGALAPGELDIHLAEVLQDEVWGQGLPAPMFDDVFDVLAQRVVGERHRRVSLGRAGQRFEAILFDCGDVLPPRIHAAYRPERREWNGTYGLELVIAEWSPAPSA